MPVTVTLPHPLATQLQTRANFKRISLGQMVVDMLVNTLQREAEDTALEEIVAQIKATPPNPASFRPATGSLLEALENAPDDPDFDLERWNREWSIVEAEMKAITRLNDIAEGLD